MRLPAAMLQHTQPVVASGGPAPSVSYSDGRAASGPLGIEPASLIGAARLARLARAAARPWPSRHCRGPVEECAAPPGATLAAAFSPSLPCRLFSLPEVRASAAGTAVGDAAAGSWR